LREGGPYSFPPAGKAYRENAASHRVWRRILIEAPDAVVVDGDDHGLAKALAGKVPVSGSVPRERTHSPLHEDQDRRLARSPQAALSQLAGQYGQELREAVYTLSVSVWGRLLAGQTSAVRTMLEPFLTGKIDSLAKPTASHYSGHLVFAALYEKTGDPRALDRVIAAARLASERPMHNEMSDSVFMVCPLLAKAGQLSKNPEWFTAAERHFPFMEQLCLRADGLYRHSPLDAAAWGRGNGFALLGMALTLSSLPAGHALQQPYRRLADTLLRWQTPAGAWRQVIDVPEAWEEFTCTAMIGWALRRGLRRGWIRGRKYESAVQRAWRAVQVRTGHDGALIDVCESTGKQKTLQDYLHREAILGMDPRGGAMAMMFAAEQAGV
jgi:rhamnogalacturonyl hydrolase YesR